MLAPLTQRMRLCLRFSFYDEGELVELLGQRCHALGWPVDPEVLPRVARRSRGTPRLALRLGPGGVAGGPVRRARPGSTAAFLRRACDLEGIDPLGLDVTQQAYLRVVAEGTGRLNMIASRLGLPIRTVSEVVEPYLIRSGLVEKDESSKRLLTQRGREHVLTPNCPEAV